MRLGGGLLVVALAAAAGCSVLVDSSGLTDGDAAGDGGGGTTDGAVGTTTDGGGGGGVDGQSDGASGLVDSGGGADATAPCTLPLAAGPYNATFGMSTNLGAPGSVAWSNAEGALTKDANAAAATLSTGQVTEALTLFGYPIALPSGATVTGLSMAVTRRRESGGVVDDAVRLVTGGATFSTPKATAAEWDSSDTTEIYGSSTDRWGLPLTRADLVSNTFGTTLTAKIGGSGSGKIAYVNSVTVTVYYCP